METIKNEVELGFTTETFPAETHMCLIFKSEEERKNIIDRFIGKGVSIGEISRAVKDLPGSERLMEYELKVNNVTKEFPVTTLCHYDANKFDGATILACLKVQTYMIFNSQIVKNPYYLKPEEHLNQIIFQ